MTASVGVPQIIGRHELLVEGREIVCHVLAKINDDTPSCQISLWSFASLTPSFTKDPLNP